MPAMKRLAALIAMAALASPLAACSHKDGKTTINVPKVHVDTNSGKQVQVPDPTVTNK
jgi:hypothetical protein